MLAQLKDQHGKHGPNSPRTPSYRKQSPPQPFPNPSCCRKIREPFSSSVEICQKTLPARNLGRPQPSRVSVKKSSELGIRGPVRGVIWALRAQSWRKSPKMSSRGSAPGPKKSKTESKRVKIDYFSTILTLFRLRLRLFGRQGREAPFSNFGPEGRK